MNDANLNSIDHADEPKSNRPRVVIVGGGFGGLAAAKALRKAPVQVILIDRTNHHVFQPLPYQVATSAFANLANLARSVRDSLTARFRKSKRNKFFPRRTRLRTPFGMIEANATKASPIFGKIGKYRAM
jgi:NADPH-dependent 2,4-dienoyl-CoA reductase/sulfur reductase-like enzyme